MQKIILYLHTQKKTSGCSVARLSRLLWEQEAAGSNPATPTKKSGTRVPLFLHYTCQKFTFELSVVQKKCGHSLIRRVYFS
jgi:hypothetical protein